MILPLAFSLLASADPSADISMVATTSPGSALPYGIFTGGRWAADPAASFVKMHIYPDDAIAVDRVEFDACPDQPLETEPRYYLNFDESSDLARRSKAGGPYVIDFKKQVSMHSLTLNFSKSKKVCLQAMRFSLKGVVYAVRVPKALLGTAKASSTLDPESSYAVMNLFDGRFENAWATKGKSSGESLTFDFNEPQRVTGVRMWNGYQRTPRHCGDNTRVKTLVVQHEDGQKEEIDVKDVMGDQNITFKKPFSGKKLVLTVKDAYAGRAYKDMVVSELRLLDGTAPMILDPLPYLRGVAKRNEADFAAAGLADVLDRGVHGQDEKGQLLLRLRRDGSMYLEGGVESWGDSTITSVTYFGLGNYEIKAKTATSLDLRIFGALRKRVDVFDAPEGGDCNGCGSDCNVGAGGSGATETIFQETLSLKKQGDGYVLTNISKKRRLSFSSMPATAVTWGE